METFEGENLIKLQDRLLSNLCEQWNKSKYFAVMLFYRENEIEPSENTNWKNYHTKIFNNSIDALNYYANTPCPASQLVEAVTMDELSNKMESMIQNFKNEDWIEENITPYI